MSSTTADGFSPLTREKIKVYTEVSRTAFGGLEGEEESVLETTDFSSYTGDKDLPEELREFIDFLLDNMLSIAAEDRETLDELRERTVSLYRVIREDIDQNIWGLIEEKDIDPESLEYLHSLITKSLDGMIDMLEENSFRELQEESKEQEMQKYFNSVSLAMNKLLVLMDEGEISQKEKEEINKKIMSLEKNSGTESREFEKVDKQII